jgi:hypothetical protein
MQKGAISFRVGRRSAQTNVFALRLTEITHQHENLHLPMITMSKLDLHCFRSVNPNGRVVPK